MNIHEYQAKNILKSCGVRIPKGKVAQTPAEAKTIAPAVGYPCVIKAQVHVGGRGKAGAIKVVKNDKDFAFESERILKMSVKGLPVHHVLIEEGMDIKKELYVAIVLDRGRRDHVIMASEMGGVDIEEVSEKQPEKILILPLGPTSKESQVTDEHINKVAAFLQLSPALKTQFVPILKGLGQAYFSQDAQLAEINPLVITGSGDMVACDAKMIIDDNALFRHAELNALKEASEDNDLEKEAHRRGLAYVKIDGNVGIIGNGAGLVMTTMDEVNRAGGKPANFLDIGGGAKKEVMQNALEVIYADPQVQGIFVNIFGGITRCDEVAKGIIEVTKNAPRPLPIVLRLSGTRAKEGRELLKTSNLISAETMSEGAQKIVAVMKGAKK